MYSYPDMQVLSEWIFSSPINCLFVSEDKDEEKVVFAVAAAQNLQVYLIDKKKGKCKLYDKKLDSKPASLAVSTKLLYMNLIEVYYQNPSIVKEDRFVNDRCRYIIDSVISQQTSSWTNDHYCAQIALTNSLNQHPNKQTYNWRRVTVNKKKSFPTLETQ